MEKLEQAEKVAKRYEELKSKVRRGAEQLLDFI